MSGLWSFHHEKLRARRHHHRVFLWRRFKAVLFNGITASSGQCVVWMKDHHFADWVLGKPCRFGAVVAIGCCCHRRLAPSCLSNRWFRQNVKTALGSLTFARHWIDFVRRWWWWRPRSIHVCVIFEGDRPGYIGFLNGCLLDNSYGGNGDEGKPDSFAFVDRHSLLDLRWLGQHIEPAWCFGSACGERVRRLGCCHHFRFGLSHK
jgi:hypothetical protein